MGLANDFVLGRARLEGLPEREALKLALAASEAVSNVVRHAYSPEEEAQFQVECRAVPLGMQVRVHDRGLPFDPATGASGGLQLMATLVDVCSFHNLGIEGKSVDLVVYRPTQPLTGTPVPSQFGTGPPEQSSLEQGETVEVRLMRREEAVDVCRLVYRAYGYSYVNEHVYYPERVVELNRTGQLMSAVAVSNRRGLLGHAAMMREPGNPIAEVGMAMVHPEARGLGLCRRLFEFLVDETVHEGLLAVYAHAVTAHGASQKVLHSLGFKDSGLLLGYAPASLSFRGIEEHLSQRESVVLVQRVLARRGRLHLYIPPHRRIFLEAALQHLGIDAEVSEATGPVPTSGQSMGMRLDSNPAHGQACFEILRASAHSVEMVHFRLRGLRHRGVQSIQLWLSLHDPAAMTLVADFEKLGFFLAGIQPGWRGQDALILQYLHDVDVDVSKLHLEGDVAKRIAEVIGRLVPLDS